MKVCERSGCLCSANVYARGFRDGYVTGYIDRRDGRRPLYSIPSSSYRTLLPNSRTCGMCNGQGSYAYDRYEPRRLSPCSMCRGTGMEILF